MRTARAALEPKAMAQPLSPLPREHRILIWLVGCSLLINHFDQAIYSLALPQIQQTLAIPEDEIGAYSGVLRLGVLVAFPLVFTADYFGRRRLLILTVIGMTLATLGTAFAQDRWQFLALQSFARCFAYAEDMLCFVVIAEMVAADRRGWALGRLAALGALGYGIAALLYGMIDALPFGWRAFYALGAAGLLFIVIARRALPETPRFLRQKAANEAGFSLRPLISLMRAYPGRFWALAFSLAPFTFGLAAATALVSKYLQDTQGFTPAQVGMLYFFGGGVSLVGYFIAGRLADLIGRRALLAVTMAAAPPLFAGIYLTDDARVIVACWIGGLFFNFASEVVLAALGGELFPTSYRATASGARAVVNVLAAMAGLAAESALYTMTGSHATAVVWLALAAPLGLVPLLFFIPETASRELEEISPEVESGLTSALQSAPARSD